MADTSYVVDDVESAILQKITLPLNHCSVPPKVFASTAYQQWPIPLNIDGIHPWFTKPLETIGAPQDWHERVLAFETFMQRHFQLPDKKQKHDEGRDPVPRPKVNYRRLILGWLFDSDSAQGAALRSWVESRFGLVTLYHGQQIRDLDSAEYHAFRQQSANATYNTNELDTQLDLLYTFCQQELAKRFCSHEHLTLYRGCADKDELFIHGQRIKLFNNLSSFSADPESALRFGSQLYAVEVPLSKIIYFESLLPRSLQGEQEYLVLGGLYQVSKPNLLSLPVG